jgi:hypothetical protein
MPIYRKKYAKIEQLERESIQKDAEIKQAGLPRMVFSNYQT